jgi:hypothetical protein
MSASSLPSTFSTSASALASPHSTRCSPQIHRSAGLADRFGGWFGSFIWIGVQVTLDNKQPVELILIEAGQCQIEAGGLQNSLFQ